MTPRASITERQGLPRNGRRRGLSGSAHSGPPLSETRTIGELDLHVCSPESIERTPANLDRRSTPPSRRRAIGASQHHDVARQPIEQDASSREPMKPSTHVGHLRAAEQRRGPCPSASALEDCVPSGRMAHILAARKRRDDRECARQVFRAWIARDHCVRCHGATKAAASSCDASIARATASSRHGAVETRDRARQEGSRSECYRRDHEESGGRLLACS